MTWSIFGVQIVGSSPLARGLHVERQAGTVGLGIIPARAGFTEGREPESRPESDHPRSRGVYTGMTMIRAFG